MKIIYSLITFLFFTLSVKSQIKPAIKFQTKGRIVNHTLMLRSDNSFEYSAIGDVVNAKSNGTWVRKKRKIILKSNTEFITGYSILKESTGNCESDTGYFYLLVLHKDGYPLAYSGVIYGDKTYSIPENGMLSLKKGSDSIIKISFLGEKYEMKIADHNQSCKTIVFFQKEVEKIYFNEEVCKYRRNKIVLFSSIVLKRAK
jgi:hypothetical protein